MNVEARVTDAQGTKECDDNLPSEGNIGDGIPTTSQDLHQQQEEDEEHILLEQRHDEDDNDHEQIKGCGPATSG